VLQCVAVCCSVWQCWWLVTGSVFQCVEVCCGVLQCVAACCSVLQYVAVCGSVAGYWQWWSSEYWGWILVWCLPLLNSRDAQIAAALQNTATNCRTATYYTTLHHTATHRNTLQHAPTRCNIYQQVPRVAPARHYTAKGKRQCARTAAS